MIHPRVLFTGDPAAATPWVGIAKKLARACYDLKIASKVYKLGSGVKIQVENIFPIAGKLAGISKVWIEAGVPLVYGFIFHPHSDSAVDGWWFPTEETEEREVKSTPYYPKHSFRYTTSWINEWNYPYYKANALYKNGVFTRDQDLWCGNQFYTKDNINYWSWWNSPNGDMPLANQLLPDIFPILTPFFDTSYGGIKYFTDAAHNTAWLRPDIFFNGQMVYSFSDANIDDYTNTVTTYDYDYIGGIFEFATNRLFVFLVGYLGRSVELYTVDIATKSAILRWSIAYPTVLISNLYSPFRFNSDGSKCSTIAGTKILTVSIDYSIVEGNIIFNSISYDLSSSYSLYESYTRNYTATGEIEDYVGTYTLDSIESYSYNPGQDKYPIALNYVDDNIIIAWMDYSERSSTITSSETRSQSKGEIYNPTSSSSTSHTVQNEKVKLVIGSNTYYLSNTEVIADYSREVNCPTGTINVELSGSSSSSPTSGRESTNKRPLYIDIKTNTIFLVSEATSDISGYSVSWDVTLPLAGSISVPYNTTLCLDKSFHINNTVIVEDLYYATVSSALSVGGGPSNYENLSGAPPNQSSSTYKNPLNMYLYISYGMATDPKGLYVVSYDYPDSGTWRGNSLVRRTGNHSNIPGFNAKVVNTIPGDNVLLFPLGLA